MMINLVIVIACRISVTWNKRLQVSVECVLQLWWRKISLYLRQVRVA